MMDRLLDECVKQGLITPSEAEKQKKTLHADIADKYLFGRRRRPIP